MKKLLLSISLLLSLPASAQLTFAQAMKKLHVCLKERAAFEQTINPQNVQDPKTMEIFNQHVKNELSVLLLVLPHMCTDQYLTTWKNRALCLHFIHQFIGLTQIVGEEIVKSLSLTPEQLQSFMQTLMITANKLDHMMNVEVAQLAK